MDFNTVKDIIGKEYSLAKKKEIEKEFFKALFKAKDVAYYNYYYDDEENSNMCSWVDVEGVGYGFTWCAYGLRKHSKLLQRWAIKREIKELFKQCKDNQPMVKFIDDDGDTNYGFMIEKMFTRFVFGKDLYIKF